MFYKTSYLATGGCSNHQGILGVGTKQYFVSEADYLKSLKILDFLLNKKTYDEVIKFCEKNNINKSIFDTLVEHNLIVKENLYVEKKDDLNFKNKLYFHALGLNGNALAKEFADTTFVIVGCGGIGNFISFAIGSLSPRKIELIDGDKIEKSNLNRQFLFTENDIGKYKVDVHKKNLVERNNKLSISEYKEYVSKEVLHNIFEQNKKNKTLVILSGDSFSALSLTAKACVKSEIPFLNIGYLNDISAIGPFYIPGISSCPFCHNALSISDDISSGHNESKILEDRINANNEAPSSFTNNALAASMGMADIIEFLSHNYERINSLNKRFGINSATFEKYVLEVNRDRKCEICSHGE